MRVLVTGGAGFIGSHVADLLLAQGHQVAIVDDLSTGHRENVPAGAAFYECDIRDERLAAIFDDVGPEAVCHLAAQMSVRISLERPRHDAAVNVEGSVHLLECAVRSGKPKIIYASTGGAIYGEPRELPCDEGHPIVPLSHYGISKHTVEHYLELYAGLYDLDYTALRLPNVYGPRQDPAGEAGVVAIFAGQMLRGEPIAIFGDGTQERDFVHVSDVARGFAAALTSGSRTSVNLGSGVGTNVLQIRHELVKLVDAPVVTEFRPYRSGEVYRIFLTGDLARQTLGWEPRTALADGLRDTLEWVRAQETVAAPVAGD
jgi:UDP-glucose 4-epimerase